MSLPRDTSLTRALALSENPQLALKDWLCFGSVFTYWPRAWLSASGELSCPCPPGFSQSFTWSPVATAKLHLGSRARMSFASLTGMDDCSFPTSGRHSGQPLSPKPEEAVDVPLLGSAAKPAHCSSQVSPGLAVPQDPCQKHRKWDFQGAAIHSLKCSLPNTLPRGPPLQIAGEMFNDPHHTPVRCSLIVSEELDFCFVFWRLSPPPLPHLLFKILKYEERGSSNYIPSPS